MADYYTEASFIIPCSPEQAATALDALDHVNADANGFTDHARAVLARPEAELDAMGRIIRFLVTHHPEQNAEGTVDDLCWGFSAEPEENKGIWIHAEEDINTEEAAVFTQAVLLAFDLPHLVVIHASHSCSKPRLDAFGGHACVVTKDAIRWHGLQGFIDAEQAAHNAEERYFVCSITEVNREYEYTSRFLMKAGKGENPDEKFDGIFLGYRGKGQKGSDGWVWYDSGLAGKDPEMSEIDPFEFSCLEKHLTVL